MYIGEGFKNGNKIYTPSFTCYFECCFFLVRNNSNTVLLPKYTKLYFYSKDKKLKYRY